MIDHLPLLDLLDEAATTDPGDAGDDDLLAAAVGLEAARCRLDVAQAHVLAEFERRGTTARELGLHTGPWLAREAHLPVGAARERVRVAVKLATVLPGTDTALTDGRISWDHAAVLARAANPRIAEDIAAIEDELVDAAAGTVFDVWRREVVGRAEELDQDGGHDPNRDLARNRLSASRTFDGSTHVSGLLTGEYGAVAAWVIDAHADRLFHRFKRDHKHHPEIAIPPRATLRALAFAEICRLAGTPGPTGPPPSVDPDLPLDSDTPTGPAGSDAPDGPAGPVAPKDSDPTGHTTGPTGTDTPARPAGPDGSDTPARPAGPDGSDTTARPTGPDGTDLAGQPVGSAGPGVTGSTRQPGDRDAPGRPPPTAVGPCGRASTPPTGAVEPRVPGDAPSTTATGTPDQVPNDPADASDHRSPTPAHLPDPVTNLDPFIDLRDHCATDSGGDPGLDVDPDPGPDRRPSKTIARVPAPDFGIDPRSSPKPNRGPDPNGGVAPDPAPGSGAEPEPEPVPTGDRWQFSADGVLPRPEVLLVLHADDPDHIYTDDGIRLPGGLTHPLLADPNLYAVVANSLGEPLDLGRQVRLATAAQRRAIRIRDGGCIFPGCDHPVQHCDVHHVIPWDDQGPTNLRLLAAGCRHHHRIWHRHGWIMRATPDAWFWWQTPAGRTFWSQRHGRQRPDPPPPPILIAPPASPLAGRTFRTPEPNPLARRSGGR